MKRIIKNYKIDKKQRNICEQMSEESVKRLEADAKRLEALKERRIEQKAKAERLEVWSRQNVDEILKIRANQHIMHPKYIIHYSPTREEPKNR
jgi:hypothetical protein